MCLRQNICPILMFLCLSALTTQADEIKPDATVCAINIANPHFYRFSDNDTPLLGHSKGVAYDIIHQTALRLNIKITMVRYPWKRCLLLLKGGQVDGVMGASYIPERTAFGHYPLNPSGDIDYRRIIYANKYWLYTNNTEVTWDGINLHIPAGSSAGTGLGYSSVKLLQKLKVPVKEEYQPSSLVASLMAKNTAVIAGYANQIEPHFDIYKNSTSNFNPVRKLPIPLNHDMIFLLLSKAFYKSQKDLAEDIWNTFVEIHNNGKYTQIFDAYLSSRSK